MYITDMLISWDEAKNAANVEKHGISFHEAETVFQDVDALYLMDTDSAEEERWVVVGYSISHRILVVVHWESEGSEEMRIISARRANRAERRTYEERR